MKKILVVAAAFAALSGCASTGKVLSKEPTEVYHSDHSVSAVAFCLANRNNVPVLDRPDGSKVVLLKNGYGGVSLAFSIYPEGEGSRIEYRRQFGTIGGQWKKCVGLEPWKDDF
ncbi:hypothetical protein [Qipengyuania algicida]|uniref:hypothetical protein n=1 Tax=Qipengyuania algicida TaxID=1836209 RepID=UPI001F1B851F|nr:hypothetical protein [Qipengyuania algicida]